MDFKLELIPIPVSDVDRSKAFYSGRAGFAVDNDVTVREGLRFVQLTPPGAACSVSIGQPRGVGGPGLPVGRFVYFSDPDGNGWAVQQIPDYGEGRTEPEVL
jgi:hypothetical protein